MASIAQIEANRKNAQKSTGPRTEAGKRKSRANALKHGLTGDGIALPTEDVFRVGERFRALTEEMMPQSTLGAILCKQVALMSVRLDRAARQETVHLSFKIRHAEADFVEARRAEAEHTLGYIGMEPITHRRKLMATPEGIDVLVQAFRNLRLDLDHHNDRWDFLVEQSLEAYLGRRSSEVPVPRSRALSQALLGNTAFLDPDDLAEIARHAHIRQWARPAMLAFLDEQIAELLAHRATLDFDAIAQDMAEAGERAMFSAEKDAILARRYEAASRRELFRVLREFREVETTGEITEPDPPESVEQARAATLDAGDALDTPPRPTEPHAADHPKPQPANTLNPESGSFGKSPWPTPALPAAASFVAPTDQRWSVAKTIPAARFDL